MTVFEGHNFFEVNGAFDCKNECRFMFYMENKVLNIFSINDFSKGATFSKKTKKNVF